MQNWTVLEELLLELEYPFTNDTKALIIAGGKVLFVYGRVMDMDR